MATYSQALGLAWKELTGRRLIACRLTAETQAAMPTRCSCFALANKLICSVPSPVTAGPSIL